MFSRQTMTDQRGQDSLFWFSNPRATAEADHLPYYGLEEILTRSRLGIVHAL